MNLPRRRFLRLAAGVAAAANLAQSATPTPAKAQVSKQGCCPKRRSRDRLEEALARIADPKGEGSRACLTVYAQAARAAADAADARPVRDYPRSARWSDREHQRPVRCRR